MWQLWQGDCDWVVSDKEIAQDEGYKPEKGYMMCSHSLYVLIIKYSVNPLHFWSISTCIHDLYYIAIYKSTRSDSWIVGMFWAGSLYPSCQAIQCGLDKK